MPISSRTKSDAARKSGAAKKTDTQKTARRQRSVQRKVDAADRRKPKAKATGAMQAGARRYPVPPFPKQHHAKPGEEWA
ncbi:short-chain dehydrogenase, partial [Mesorhizobium sp. B2-7-1]